MVKWSWSGSSSTWPLVTDVCWSCEGCDCGEGCEAEPGVCSGRPGTFCWESPGPFTAASVANSQWIWNVKSSPKKLAWTDLDILSKSQKSKWKNWRELVFTKLKKVSSSASVSSQILFITSHKKSWSDKRCSRCYTLWGFVFADVLSREEVKMLLQKATRLKNAWSCSWLCLTTQESQMLGLKKLKG